MAEGKCHPKLDKVEELVAAHFGRLARAADPAAQSRVMIFSQYRHSVEEIAARLARHAPQVAAMTFVGQATNKSGKGLNQKEQARVVQQFKAGGYNTLVATCIGEEGLDIGEVDLIVCYDVTNPTAMVQRMGRTGRKRQGYCKVMLNEVMLQPLDFIPTPSPTPRLHTHTLSNP